MTKRWLQVLASMVVAGGAVLPEASSQVMPFDVFGLREGLPQSQATALAQDHDGYLWVGTWGGGLARFNGESFTAFGTDQGLPTNRVHELLVAGDGTLWAALVGGLAAWRDHRLEVVEDPLINGRRWRALAEDAAGRLWLGGDGGLAVREHGAWRDGGLGVEPPPTVHDLLVAPGGVVVVSDRGLLRLAADGTVERVVGPGAPPESYRTAARTADELWLGTLGHGLHRQRGGVWEEVHLPGARNIYRIVPVPSGSLLVASQDGGLYRRGPGRSEFERIDVERGLPVNLINDVLEDAEGSLWVATEVGGLARLRSGAVSTHGVAGEFPSPCIFGMAGAGDDGTMWIGTMRGAVHYRTRPGFEVLETITGRDGIADDYVWKVALAPGGEVWIQSETAYSFRPAKGTRFEVARGLPLPAVTQDLAVDSAGRLWTAGYDATHCVSMRDTDGAWRSWGTDADGGNIDRCRAIAVRRAGGIWFAEGNRIFVAEGSAVRRDPQPPPLSSLLSVLFEDSRGRLWAGDDTGLAVRDLSGRWQLLNGTPGLTSARAYFAGESSDGTVWVGTQHGATRFLPDGRILPFTLEDGLAELETNTFAFHAEPTGVVWLGTISGLTRFDPALERPLTRPPRLVVEAAELPARQVSFPAALDLAWDERTVTFHVALLTFRNHSRAAYRARLEGMEDDWLPLRRSGELRYTNLPPGRHRLRLQAVNEAGQWSDEILLPVRVRPPFWLTAWFRGLGIIGLLAAAAGAHGLRTTLLRRRNRDLERLVAQRTQELTSANQELERLATHDALTGLPNRRAVVARLAAELASREGVQRRFACLIVDLDRFKEVNDDLGHAAGDDVLRTMARKIEAVLRPGDVVGRYGGDEFLVLLPGADLEAAEAVAGRIARIEETAYDGERSVTVTTSCGGVAVGAGVTADDQMVLAAADDLLYEVKRAGRRGFRVTLLAAAPDA